ncbi:MAG: ABC transporter ATP-binding protein [Myxococcaceae bacterium]|nr:MAG: ABC transporter ATP-binding protein [Myxococcaceae bacterium]
MLSLRNLVKVYPGPVTALRGVDLEVPRGMFGLLGPNGAGKSTLMKILSGLLEPTSGEVTLDGLDLVRHPEALRPHLGYLPQEFGFYPYLSGQDMLRYLLELKGVTAPQGLKALCAQLLERVNLTFAAKRKVKEYSGGMRQRLGIAQALAGNPRLIIVDEPTAGLDPEERQRFYRLLAEIAHERTVLLSTHIVEDVAMLCPRFAVIRHGRVVAITSPSEAKAALHDALYEGTVPPADMAGFQQAHRVTQAVLFEGRNRVRIHAPAGVPVPPGFERTPPTLEDAYLLLMKDAPGPSAQAPVVGA